MANVKRPVLPIIITAIVAFGSAIAVGYIYLSMQQKETAIPDTSIIEADPDPADNSGPDVDVSLKYAGYATLERNKKLIVLNFTNPHKSRKDLSLDIIANIDGEDIVLAKTSKVHPGYKITSVKAIDQTLPDGDYKGKFIVHFYDEQGNEEIVKSEIAVNIYVK